MNHEKYERHEKKRNRGRHESGWRQMEPRIKRMVRMVSEWRADRERAKKKPRIARIDADQAGEGLFPPSFPSLGR